MHDQHDGAEQRREAPAVRRRVVVAAADVGQALRVGVDLLLLVGAGAVAVRAGRVDLEVRLGRVADGREVREGLAGDVDGNGVVACVFGEEGERRG